MSIFKRLAAKLPSRWQDELKRIHFTRQISNGTFITDEPEYNILNDFILPGDWVIDIGANVGHYTKRFSELVGDSGRVIAFEPVPTTFCLLSSNVQQFIHSNVTLINSAVSDKLNIVGMSLPTFSTGLTNYYEANVTPRAGSDLNVLTLSLDSMNIHQHISLIKIDAEGHEDFVLAGMQALLKRHHPVLIIENPSQAVCQSLADLGYTSRVLPGSPNQMFSIQ